MPNSAVSQTGFSDPPTRSRAAAHSYPIYCSVCLGDKTVEDIVTVSADHGTIVHVTETQVLGEPNFKGQWLGKLLQLHHLNLYSSEIQCEFPRLPACYLSCDHSMEKTTCIRKRMW